jgi:uncharacterized protein
MIIRDPLFGFVKVSDDERRIIDCELFQRLRGVKQLSYTNLVYPAAMHTRFEHSIGAMHVAGMMADQLDLPPEDRRRAPAPAPLGCRQGYLLQPASSG